MNPRWKEPNNGAQKPLNQRFNNLSLGGRFVNLFILSSRSGVRRRRPIEAPGAVRGFGHAQDMTGFPAISPARGTNPAT